MKEINSRDFFDDSEAVISKVTSADVLEEEDSKPDTSDTEEEEWVPKASRRANFSKIIRSFMNSSKPMLTFTFFERCLVQRIAHQWQIEHQSYGDGKERYIVVWKPENRQGKHKLNLKSCNHFIKHYYHL